jgi:putative transposase
MPWREGDRSAQEGISGVGRPTKPVAANVLQQQARFDDFIDYPFHDWTATVTNRGRICYKARKINLSQVFAGQNVGVKQVSDRIWLVSFMDCDLGYFDDETCRLEPIENPFGPKLLPMPSGMDH